MDKPEKIVQSIEEFQPRTVEIRIEREEDVLIFSCRALSYGEWIKLGETIPMPPPPIAGVDRLGRPVINPSDPGYLAAKNEAEHKRSLIRLAAFLNLEFPEGMSAEEKANAIEARMEPGLVRALERAMSMLATEGMASASVRAKSFLRNGASDYARVQEPGLEY